MAVQQRPTYEGEPVEINDTETHRGDTMHHVTTQSGISGWVFESELSGVDVDE